MKLISIYTPDQSELKDKWFLPSVKDKIEIETHLFESHGNAKSPGAYSSFPMSIPNFSDLSKRTS
jgi:hypothetical protein